MVTLFKAAAGRQSPRDRGACVPGRLRAGHRDCGDVPVRGPRIGTPRQGTNLTRLESRAGRPEPTSTSILSSIWPPGSAPTPSIPGAASRRRTRSSAGAALKRDHVRLTAGAGAGDGRQQGACPGRRATRAWRSYPHPASSATLGGAQSSLDDEVPTVRKGCGRREPDRLSEATSAAGREAEGAFGDPSVYLEEAHARPRHIEVQVLADSRGDASHLCERDCSVQHRHRKVIDVARAPNPRPVAALESAHPGSGKAVADHTVDALDTAWHRTCTK